jgi:hypothetical protein
VKKIVMRVWWTRLVLCATICAFAAGEAAAMNVDSRWRVLSGSSPLAVTAARDLAEELRTKFDVTLQVASAQTGINGPAIVIGTVEDNSLIARENSRKAFNLRGDDKERYHLVLRGDRVYCVGATPKGAMNAAFRFADRATLSVEGLDDARSPIFRHRIAGHLINQSAPPDWTEEDQARFYARHYINVVWGEKHGPPLSLEARQKYGLGLMIELRFPSAATPEWWSDSANAGAAYYHKQGSERRVISPFDPAGREWYLEGHQRLIEKNPDIAILYGIFGDYNVIPGPDSVRINDGKPYGHTREETMLEILKIMREAIGNRDIIPRAWMWHAFYDEPGKCEAFMRELPSHGVGPMYNEAGDNDCWVIKLDNFDEVSLKAKKAGESAYGPDYLSLCAVGGACESVNPVIGMPLPRIAAYRLGRLASAGVRDVAFWWGSAEGWIYQPNLRVFQELLWSDNTTVYGGSKDFSLAEPLLQRIAERDFGKTLGPKVVNYWRDFEKAIVTDRPLYKNAAESVYGNPEEEGLRLYDWFQRMGVYTEWVFGEAVLKPLTPETLSRLKYGGWGRNDYATANYKAVLEKLAAAQTDLAALVSQASTAAARERLACTHQWTELYRLLLTAQYHHLEALKIVGYYKTNELESPKLRAALTPVVRASIENTRAILNLAAKFPPNFNITMAHRNVAFNECVWARESLKFKGKLTEMEIWLQDLTSLAKSKLVTASSVDMQTPGREAKFAVDGDPSTLWASKFSDDQWIQVDLGKQCVLHSLVLDWKTAYAKEFAIQVADSPGEWTTALRVTDGTDGRMLMELPQGTKARFVRVQGIRRGSPFGYALREIEIFGKE